MNALTPKQTEILDFIRNEHSTTRFTPSTREIQRHFGFRSQTSVMQYLNALRKKGAIDHLPKLARQWAKSP